MVVVVSPKGIPFTVTPLKCSVPFLVAIILLLVRTSNCGFYV